MSLNVAKAEYEKLSFGSLDEMSIEEHMFNAVRQGKTVRVIDTDGIEYIGKATHFSSGANEDDGYATFIVEDLNNTICLGENEIRSIEVISQ